MILTPLEIRQKTFEKKFRGYDQLEVESFLKVLSNEWESIVEEKKILEIKLDTEKTELKRLQKIEHTLFKTLQTAEETGKTIIQQANREASIILDCKKNEANQYINEAKSKVNRLVANTESATKNVINKAATHLKELHKELLNLTAEYNKILVDLEYTAGDIQKKIEVNKTHLASKNIEAILEESKALLNDVLAQIDDLPISTLNIDVPVKEYVDVDQKTSNVDSVATSKIKPDKKRDDTSEKKHLLTKLNEENFHLEWEGKRVEVKEQTKEDEALIEKPPNKKANKVDDISFFDQV